MKQTLIFLPTEVFGLPLFGSGLLFWTILVAGLVAVVRSLFFRKGRADDALFYATITALGLFLVRCVAPRICENNGFPIRGYGVFLTLAIAIATLLTIWRAKRRWNYPADAILSIVFVAAFFGILGARLFYVVEYWRDIRGANFRETLVNAIDVTSGGLVVYGSILGGIAAVVVFLKLKKLPILATLDLFAPALALGVAIGRVGCLMNGCCFGGPCELPWAITFPSGSPAHVLQMEEGVASLYGLTFELPSESPSDSSDTSSKTLFSLKSTHKNAATETFAPIVVASVDSGCAAERAGIVPGDRVREVGIVPKDFLIAANGTRQATQIQRFRPENNAQIFYFFLQIWAGDPERDVWLVLEKRAESSDDANVSPTPTLRDVVFHPEPSRPVPVHPTQLYSAATALGICCLLLIFARFAKRDGLVFAGLLILYPINRFCLEMIRTDEESFLGTGLTVSQCVSLALAATGAALFVYLFATPPRQALANYFPQAQKPDADSSNE